MEAAFAWIGRLAEFFGAFFPRLLIVKSSHRAVKYVFGKRVVLLEPGIHCYWPIVTEVEIVPVVRQVLDLTAHILETSDGIPVVSGGLVCYEIDDAEVFLADNENAYESIDDVATAAIRDVVISGKYEDLRKGGRRFDRRLTNRVQRLLRPFGVSVEYARLNDFARVRPVHLSGGLTNQVTNH